MHEITSIILYTAAAGACIPLGGAIARIERIRPLWLEREMRHAIIAFGGGILVAAVALVLVPDGMYYTANPLLSVVMFILGGLGFFTLEHLLGNRRREKPQFSAMLLDFIPESLALGGVFALGSTSAPLLALFIGLQNLPEGFNAYRELMSRENARRTPIFLVMFALVPLGPLLGVLGWLYASENPVMLGAMMMFAAGGILYLIFQDIAPQSRMQRHWGPPLGAVLGFSLGLLGKGVIATT